MTDREKNKKDIITRLRRVEGQIKGIEKMIENDACCREVLIQIAAVRAAVNKAGAVILQNYASQCFVNTEDGKVSDEKFDELIKTLTMFLK